MIGRLYTVSIGSQAQTAAKTLIEIASAADSVTLVERLSISQTSFDTSENLGTKTQRITTTLTTILNSVLTHRAMMVSPSLQPITTGVTPLDPTIPRITPKV